MGRDDVLTANHLLIAPTERESAHLKKLGFNSVHNPFRYEEWNFSFENLLEGKTVIILQGLSNDGYECNDVLEAILSGWLSYEKVVLSDEICNLSRDKLLEAIQTSIQGAKFRFKDAIISAEDFISKEISPKKTILKPWLTEQSINPFAGWRGTGKTWVAVSIADAITRGESFGPWPTVSPVPVCYLDAELPSSDVQERFRIVASLSKARRKAPLYIYSDCYANSLGLPRANLSNQEWRETLKVFLIKEGFKILVLDNLSSLSPGIDELLKRDYDPTNQWFLELRFSGISTIPIFHAGKKGDQRGTSAHEDNVDTSIILSHPPGYTPEQGARFILKFKKTRVRNADLHMISDYEFSFSEVEGRAKWTWKVVRGRTQIEVLKLLNRGMKQSEIVEALKIDKGYVSRIKTNAIKKGFLTQDGKLTPEGLRLLDTGDSDEEF